MQNELVHSDFRNTEFVVCILGEQDSDISSFDTDADTNPTVSSAFIVCVQFVFSQMA